MTSDELEVLVIRLVGDVSNYVDSLGKAQQSTNLTAEEAKKAQEKIQGFGAGLKVFGASIMSTMASFGAMHFLHDILHQFEGRELILLKLAAAIDATGRSAVNVIPAYKAFAKEMADVTTIAGDTVLAMLQQAESLGLSGAKAERAVKNAIALAALRPGDVNPTAMLRITAMLEQGQTTQLMRMMGTLRAIKDPTLRAAEAHRLLGQSFKVAEAAAEASAGQMKQLHNAWIALEKDLGESVDHIVRPFVVGMKDLLKWLRSMSPEFKQAIVAAAGFAAILLSIGPILSTIGYIFTVVFSPSMAVIAALILLVTALVGSFGGFKAIGEHIQEFLGDSLNYVKDKWEEFAEWFKPIGRAMQSLWNVVWKSIEDLAVAAWEAIKKVWEPVAAFFEDLWKKMGLEGENFFDMIRNFLVEFFIDWEFIWTHAGEIFELLGVSFNRICVEMFDTMTHYLTKVIPAALTWLQNNWAKIMIMIFSSQVQGVKDLVTYIGEAFKSINWGELFEGMRKGLMDAIYKMGKVFQELPKILSGAVDFSSIWAQDANKGTGDALQQATEAAVKNAKDQIEEMQKLNQLDPFIMPEQQISEAQQRLRDLEDKLRKNLVDTLKDFRKQKLREMFAVSSQAVGLAAGALADYLSRPIKAKVIGAVGGAIAEAIAHGLPEKIDLPSAEKPLKEVKKAVKDKDIGKFDAAAFGSAEALGRIAEFQEKADGKPQPVEIVGFNPPDLVDGVDQMGGDIAKMGDDAHKQLDLLAQLLEETKKQNGKPKIELEPVGLV